MYDPSRHHRQSIRLREFDYAHEGAYFVTVCVHNRASLLGEVHHGQVLLSGFGAIAAEVWLGLPAHYASVRLGEFVVMPNHVHGIVIFDGDVGAGFKPAPTDLRRPALPEIVRGFKTFSSRRINALRGTHGRPFWQRNYYERVIRDEVEFTRISEYIPGNPGSWSEDEYHP
jgi:REP element-mobilizing transposase RayT